MCCQKSARVYNLIHHSEQPMKDKVQIEAPRVYAFNQNPKQKKNAHSMKSHHSTYRTLISPILFSTSLNGIFSSNVGVPSSFSVPLCAFFRFSGTCPTIPSPCNTASHDIRSNPLRGTPRGSLGTVNPAKTPMTKTTPSAAIVSQGRSRAFARVRAL